MWNFKNFILSIVAILLFGCDSKNNITSYKIKKPSAIILKWIAPKTWQEIPPGKMLLASFNAFDSKNKSIDISISMFPGNVGGTEGNVNRWRKQINLSPQNSEQISKYIQPVVLPLLGDAEIVFLKNNENNKSIKTIIIPNQNGQTIFIKMIGNLDSILELQSDFDLFYQSIYWDN